MSSVQGPAGLVPGRKAAEVSPRGATDQLAQLRLFAASQSHQSLVSAGSKPPPPLAEQVPYSVQKRAIPFFRAAVPLSRRDWRWLAA